MTVSSIGQAISTTVLVSNLTESNLSQRTISHDFVVIWVLQGTGGRDVPKTKCLPYGTDGTTKYLRILDTLQHWVRECRDLFLLLVDQEAKELLYLKTSPW